MQTANRTPGGGNGTPEDKAVYGGENGQKTGKPKQAKQEYLLVDGYNIIFAWDELKELSEVSIDGARGRLLDILCNYQGMRQCEVIAVFDAYRVKGHDTDMWSTRRKRRRRISILSGFPMKTAENMMSRWRLRTVWSRLSSGGRAAACCRRENSKRRLTTIVKI